MPHPLLAVFFCPSIPLNAIREHLPMATIEPYSAWFDVNVELTMRDEVVAP
jgi:hypothetical protein